MINKILNLLLLLVLTSASVNSQSTGTSRKVLLTLQPGEKIMYAESCLNLSLLNNQVYLVTTIDDKVYVYENGQRRGPFEDAADANINACPDEENFNNKCSLYETAIAEFDPEITIPNEDGSYSIKYNNKKYGPYMYISNIHLWPDKSGFVATTINKEMKMSVVTSEGLNLALDGDIEKIHFSPKGRKFIFALKEKQAIDMDVLKTDFSKMTQEQIMEFAKKQQEKIEKAPELKSYIYINGTTKLGPYKLNAFYSNNPAFTTTGGENWIMTMDDALYINGTKIKDFPGVDLNTCRIWVSGDGKRYVITSYDKVIFSDGKEYGNPLEPSAFEKDGKIFVKWVSLENEKELVFYTREL